jgi:methylmalonyl-CoA/ethylmalonyl-CoA epimerase
MSLTKKELPGLIFHHTGVLVQSIEYSVTHYATLFGKANISETYIVASQKVKVCFIKIGVNSYLELIQPIEEDSTVSRLLKKRISYYHVAYLVKNIMYAIEQLEKENYKAFELFSSEAFNGNRCVFLYNPDAHLIELIEDPSLP